MRKFVFFIIVISFVSSCKQDKKKAEAEQIVSEWTGKEIRFPEEYVCNFSGRDTATVSCMELFEREYKILFYVDSTGCTDCKLRLFEWKHFIKETDSLSANKLSFLLFFHPKDKKELQLLLRRDRFDYPVFIDTDNAIDKLNHFPAQAKYQCFLLDKNNKVLMVGNPALNPKIWKLYKQIISGQNPTTTETIPTTSVFVKQQEIEISDLQVKKKSTGVFRLKNTGNQPLLIARVETSCGCTVPSWEKKPVEPGEETEIRVEIQPEATGAFRKIIRVYCNVKKGIISLTVKGMVNK